MDHIATWASLAPVTQHLMQSSLYWSLKLNIYLYVWINLYLVIYSLVTRKQITTAMKLHYLSVHDFR